MQWVERADQLTQGRAARKAALLVSDKIANYYKTSMKHPVKRLAFEIPITDENRKRVLNSFESDHAFDAAPLAGPGQVVMAKWVGDDGSVKLQRMFQVLGANERVYNIPEVALVVLHFDNAYFNWKHMNQHREKLDSSLLLPRSETLLNELYGYYGRCISCILSLFASMEALANSYVQTATVYKRKGSKWTSTTTAGFGVHVEEPSVLAGTEILRLPIMEKLLKVLPQLSGKKFAETHHDQWVAIKSLKKLRDETTHPKSIDRRAEFGQHLAQLFTYDFHHAMEAVKSFINYYARSEHERIEDCQCDWEW